MFPQAGGPYVYLRAAYGPLPAFLFGWTEFLVMRTGSMATLAAAFSRYFGSTFLRWWALSHEVWEAGAAAGAIAVVTAVNVLGHLLGRAAAGRGHAAQGRGRACADRPAVRARRARHGASVAGLAREFGASWRRDDGRDGGRALGVRRLDQPDAAGRGGACPGPECAAGDDPGMAILILLYIALTLVYHWVLPLETGCRREGRPRPRARSPPCTASGYWAGGGSWRSRFW